MNVKWSSWLSVLFAVTITASFAQASEKPNKAWRATMGDLSKALSEAVPLLYPDPTQDSKVLTAKIKNIYEITKKLDSKLNHAMVLPDSDPALPYIASLLRGDIERAYQSIQEGHVDYAKSVVRSSVAYCIACHTRMQSGVEFPLLKAFAEPLKRASWIEKIEFETASRQFDSVLSDVMSKLEAPGTLGISPLDLERASRVALSILVRFKQDPDRASFLASAIAKSNGASVSLKEAAKVWQKDIRVWQDEKAKTYASEQALLDAARSLIKGGEKESADLSGHSEVRFLRSSVLMHDLLKNYPNSKNTAEAFYITGLSYDRLREIGLWSLHEMYFLACIDKAPHTALSQKCYKNYEESVTLGYTGSSGMHIPTAVRKHLQSVKAQTSLQ